MRFQCGHTEQGRQYAGASDTQEFCPQCRLPADVRLSKDREKWERIQYNVSRSGIVIEPKKPTNWYPWKRA
jgi:hypothetical protein